MKLILSLLFSSLFVLQLPAAMVRVVSVQDGRTLVVERNAVRETITLAGIVSVDEVRAAELLRWTVGTSWVLAEPREGGGYFVFRSPDALFVNRELVLRGFAHATMHGVEPESNLRVTYLGEVNPDGVRPAVRDAPPRTGSGTSRRSSGSPSPRTRAARAKPASRPTSTNSRTP